MKILNFTTTLVLCIGINFINISSVAAQEVGTHFMQNIWQANYTNPGLVPRQTFSLTISPFLGINTSNSSNSLFIDNQITESSFESYLRGLDNLTSKANFSADLNLGFKVKKFFFSIGNTTKINANTSLSNDAVNLLLQGNAAITGQPMDLGIPANILAYRETSIGINYMVSKSFTIGARAKRYKGLAYLDTRVNNVSLSAGNNNDIDINLNYDMLLASSLLNDLPSTGTLSDVKRVDGLAGSGYAIFLPFGVPLNNSGGNGWGFDFGAQINLKDKIRIAASILDIGSISWSDLAYDVNMQSQYSYDATTFNPLLSSVVDLFEEDTDLILDEINISTSKTELIQKLPIRSYISANVKFIGLEFGALLYNEFGEENFTSTAFSVRRPLGPALNLGAVYVLQEELENTFGANVGIDIGAFQVYAIMDDISALISPNKNIEQGNIRVGVGLSLGEKKMKEIIEDKEESQ